LAAHATAAASMAQSHASGSSVMFGGVLMGWHRTNRGHGLADLLYTI